MATHSSVLAWRIPGMAEPGGLLSMGSHRVGHDWSDLAAAGAAVSFICLPMLRSYISNATTVTVGINPFFSLFYYQSFLVWGVHVCLCAFMFRYECSKKFISRFSVFNLIWSSLSFAGWIWSFTFDTLMDIHRLISAYFVFLNINNYFASLFLFSCLLPSFWLIML